MKPVTAGGSSGVSLETLCSRRAGSCSVTRKKPQGRIRIEQLQFSALTFTPLLLPLPECQAASAGILEGWSERTRRTLPYELVRHLPACGISVLKERLAFSVGRKRGA
jgi:hypothetical protein